MKPQTVNFPAGWENNPDSINMKKQNAHTSFAKTLPLNSSHVSTLTNGQAKSLKAQLEYDSAAACNALFSQDQAITQGKRVFTRHQIHPALSYLTLNIEAVLEASGMTADAAKPLLTYATAASNEADFSSAIGQIPQSDGIRENLRAIRSIANAESNPNGSPMDFAKSLGTRSIHVKRDFMNALSTQAKTHVTDVIRRIEACQEKALQTSVPSR